MKEIYGKIFRCQICGRFIGYKEIPDEVNIYYVPDIEITIEETRFVHKKCEY